MNINDFIHKDIWQPVDGLELESAALEAVKGNVNTLVIAGPGAGKTELLAQRACFLLQTNTAFIPKRILAVSFKKDAAENLSKRVEKRCGKPLAQRFDSMTYDAFAKHLLDRFNSAIPDSHRPNRDYEIAKDLDIRRTFELSGYIPPAGLRNNEINKALLGLLVNSKLPPSEKLIVENDTLQGVWENLLRGNSSYGFEPQLNFQMISRLTEYLIRINPLIQSALQMTYSHVFLDEFQDTTDIQYDLIRTCFLGSGTIITAVGDSKQRIMLWARAMRNVFEKFKRDFSARELRLVMNHRSAPRLVQLQSQFYGLLNEANHNIEVGFGWNEDDGEIYLHRFRDHIQEAKMISDEIEGLLNNGVDITDICILVKQLPDTYGKELIKELESRGINARNEGLYQDLLNEEGIKILIYIFYLSLVDRAPDEWIYVRDFLLMVKGLDEDSKIEDVFKIQKDFQDFLYKFKNRLKNVGDKDGLKVNIKDIINFLDIEKIKSIYPKYKRGSYFRDLIDQMIDLLWNEYIITDEWLRALENLQGHNSIPIMTIHKSKGLEYDTVFFIGLEDSAFWNFKRQPDEDRCAFFVALSRAKRRVDFTFSKKRPGKFTDNQYRHNIDEFYTILGESNIIKDINYDT